MQIPSHFVFTSTLKFLQNPLRFFVHLHLDNPANFIAFLLYLHIDIRVNLIACLSSPPHWQSCKFYHFSFFPSIWIFPANFVTSILQLPRIPSLFCFHLHIDTPCKFHRFSIVTSTLELPRIPSLFCRHLHLGITSNSIDFCLHLHIDIPCKFPSLFCRRPTLEIHVLHIPSFFCRRPTLEIHVLHIPSFFCRHLHLGIPQIPSLFCFHLQIDIPAYSMSARNISGTSQWYLVPHLLFGSK